VVSGIEFVPAPETGRRFATQRLVRLSDAGPDGALRVDGAVRYLQDVASDDWQDTGVVSDDTWVVRRTSLRLSEGGRWPILGERVDVTTWCGGTGAAWAERRTTIASDGRPQVEAVALWVPVDPAGRPRRLQPSFFDVYGEAAGGRRVAGRVPTASVSTAAHAQSWAVRRADLDIVGHVNNAAVWCAMSEVVTGTVARATLTHHGSLERSDAVTLWSDASRLWLVVDDEVRVSGEFDVE
jgi:acyl-ACP thioesterase